MSFDTAARTRFAPSPTGYLHIGSLRTVIFSWLWAQHTGGKFLLRIDDTDRNRYVADADQQILSTLQTMGLNWSTAAGDCNPDGSPIRQSNRLHIYNQYAQQLQDQGILYKCWCTPDRLQMLGAAQKTAKQSQGYDRHCRYLSNADRQTLLDSGQPYTLRLAVPDQGVTVVNDLIRGAIQFDNSLLKDQVMIKSDGYPTYHFAVVIDDHLMNITHVLRGDEWIATAPLHVMLYQAFDWQQPVWVHVPVVLGKDGKKLSKRNGDTSVTDYLAQGFLPDALINYLALVGWGTADADVMSLDDLVACFDINDISTSAGIFDVDKLTAFNAQHIGRLNPSDLAVHLVPFLQRDGVLGDSPTDHDMHTLRQLAPLLQPRLKLLSAASPWVRPFFQNPGVDRALLVPSQQDQQGVADILGNILHALGAVDDWNTDSLDKAVRAVTDTSGLGKAVFMMLRIAITGSKVSLPLFDTMAILGKAGSIKRLQHALELILP